MKILVLIAFLSLSLSSAFAAKKTKPHFELELSSAQYMKILSQRKTLSGHQSFDEDEQTLKPVLDLGQRNLQFLVFLNEHRGPSDQISLTSPETAPASPIDHPKTYNATIAYQAYVQLLKEMPAVLQQILLSNQPFPTELPMPKADYIYWGLKTDHVYQTAARWLTLKPYLQEYIQAKESDIRGYYYLSRDANLPEKLARWKSLPAPEQAQLQEWLVGVCYNSQSLAYCQQTFEQLVATNGDLAAFYAKHAPLSQKLYDSFFKLLWPRTDVTFRRSQPEVLRIPFVHPKNESVLSYLRDNIEDEFKWLGWQLRLDFLTDGDEDTTAHIEWEAGVTPHVSDPNTIVMDENQPMTEYESKWTIRHEFGHIIGFPDCYVEFYDTQKGVMTSYQIDITNLMCSRRGKLQQTHFDELKRIYLKD